MKRLILSAVVCCALGGAGIYAAEHEHADHAKAPTTRPTTRPTTQASGKPINKYCAINRDEEIDPNVTTVYKGKVIGFCCEDCIPKFKKNPEKYMKDLK